MASHSQKNRPTINGLPLQNLPQNGISDSAHGQNESGLSKSESYPGIYISTITGRHLRIWEKKTSIWCVIILCRSLTGPVPNWHLNGSHPGMMEPFRSPAIDVNMFSGISSSTAERIMPVCDRYDINMAIHPDDPAWSVFGHARTVEPSGRLRASSVRVQSKTGIKL